MMRLAAGWERFWFRPQPTSTLALVRIAVGGLALAWALSLGPDLINLYAPDGGVVRTTTAAKAAGGWDPLGMLGSTGVVVAYVALLLAAAALILGYHSRLAALIVFLALLAFARRNPFVLNDGDALLRLLALYLVLAPAGASLSVDRLRVAPDAFWEFPARAPWALRLIQIQLCAIYLSTVWQRALGEHWTDGTAVSYILRLEELQRLSVPAGLRESALFAGAATIGVLALELALPLALWFQRTRPWAIGAAVVLHASIEYALRVGFFSLVVMACLLAFVSPPGARRWILAMRDRVGPAGRDVTHRDSVRPVAKLRERPVAPAKCGIRRPRPRSGGAVLSATTPRIR